MATVKNHDNAKSSALSKFLSAGISEIDLRGRGEGKSSLALAYAVLASDDADTLSSWTTMIRDYGSTDKNLKELSRNRFNDYINGENAFVETLGDKERHTQDYRNLVTRQFKRMQFAVDLHALGYRPFLIIRETAKGGVIANVKGGSDYALRLWVARGWNDQKSITSKRSSDIDIIISLRAQHVGLGEISWAQLEEAMAGWCQRKQKSHVKAATITASKPLGAIRAVQSIINNDPAAIAHHFTTAESQLLVMETVEDIAGVVISGDDPEMIKLRKNFTAAVDALCEHFRSTINRKATLLVEEAS